MEMAKNITGVPTEAKKAAARKAAKGPKQGSARANQSAKYSNPDEIVTSKAASAKNTETHMVTSRDKRSVTFPTTKWVGRIRELSAVGGSMTALEAELAKQSRAKLAKGVDGRNSPNAAKAVADNAAKAKKAAPAKAAPKKAAPKPAKKVDPAKGANRGADRPYKVLVKADKIVAKEGSWRLAMLTCIANNKSTDAARACLKKNREFGSRVIDFGWAAKEGYIQF